MRDATPSFGGSVRTFNVLLNRHLQQSYEEEKSLLFFPDYVYPMTNPPVLCLIFSNYGTVLYFKNVKRMV